MQKTAFVFPGQGSQVVGMGAALAAASAHARHVFEEVDEVLHQPLMQLMQQGPLETLTLTSNAQPAIMASSLAVIRVLEQEAGVLLSRSACFVLGHSLGEYSALCAAGSFYLSDAAKLLRVRGDAMQAAVPAGAGSMAAVLGEDYDAVENVCREAAQGDVCTPANDNAPGQIVISGHRAAIERAIALVKARGKKAIPLPVSAPFHCSLMAPAASTMQEALVKSRLVAPFVPLVSNVTALPTSDPQHIREQLVTQVTGRVRWRESIEGLVALGVERFVEIGTGKALTGMIRRIAPDCQAMNIESPADIDAFLKIL